MLLLNLRRAKFGLVQSPTLKYNIFDPKKQFYLKYFSNLDESNIQAQKHTQINFTEFSKFIQLLSKENSRSTLTKHVAEFFQKTAQQNTQDFLDVVKLISCNYFQPFSSYELALSENIIINVLAQFYNENVADVQNYYMKFGDFDQVCEYYYQKHHYNQSVLTYSSLTVQQILVVFQQIASVQGEGSQATKEQLVYNLLKQANSFEDQGLLIRLLQKHLKVGVSSKSIIEALKNIRSNSIIEQNLQYIEEDIFGYYTGLCQSDQQNIKVGLPLPHMSCKAINDITQIPKELQKFSKKVICEFKYDGERTQIHYKRNQFLKLISRNMENQNIKFSQLIVKLQEYFEKMNITQCILDAEVIAYDQQKQDILPFSQLQSRQRKIDDDEVINNEQIPIQEDLMLVLFDVILLNDTNYLQKNQILRKEALNNFKENDFVKIIKYTEFDLNEQHSIQEIEDLYKQSLKANFEGIVIKSFCPKKTYYDIRGKTQWLKIKKLIGEDSLADTLDLIPIGAYWGKGKRSSKFGSYLIAVYNDDLDAYEAICKLGTGFDDKFLDESTIELQNYILQQKPSNYSVNKRIKPDVWLQSEQVWEIAADSFSASPLYTVAKNTIEQDRGISLRFPRFIKVRTDKSIQQSTKVNDIIEMYKSEKNV